MSTRKEPKDNTSHLPLYGVGPIYVIIIAALTATAFFLRNAEIFSPGRLDTARIPLVVAGAVVIAAGVILWLAGAVWSKLDDNIMENKLVTSGVFAWVRNPIYSAFLFICTGIILIIENAFFFVLPVIYWLFLTVLMMKTEEKWLKKQFGDEYTDYCRRVNRCIPWFPKKK